MTNDTLIIDATGQKLGRLASVVAKHLRGKNSTDFAPHLVPKAKVKVINASRTVLTGKKLATEIRVRYSGYPGGLKHNKLTKIVATHGQSGLVREAVLGMIPRNKLRPIIMKNLTIEE